MKRKSMKQEIAALTDEVRRLREEVAALRLYPPVQFVPLVAPVFQPYHPPPYQPYWWEYPSTAPQFTFTCNAEGPTTLDGVVS